jgi:hypothetical protein
MTAITVGFRIKMNENIWDAAIQAVIESLGDISDVHSVTVTQEARETVKVTVEKGSAAAVSARVGPVVTFQSEGSNYRFHVVVIEGPAVVPDIETKEPPPRSAAPLLKYTGGIRCQARGVLGWGTAGVFVWSAEMKPPVGNSCAAKPAMITCCHVVGKGSVPPGTPLAYGGNEFGHLNCFIDLYNFSAQMDCALGTYPDTPDVGYGEIIGIGTITSIRMPVIGEQIRKTGATTGTTTGSIIGRAALRVTLPNGSDRLFLGLYVTSPGGFACPGDSGSIIVANDMAALGVHSWGDSLPCEHPDRRGYFWRLKDPGPSVSPVNFSLYIGRQSDFAENKSI